MEIYQFQQIPAIYVHTMQKKKQHSSKNVFSFKLPDIVFYENLFDLLFE
jgi:hypothetical protein